MFAAVCAVVACFNLVRAAPYTTSALFGRGYDSSPSPSYRAGLVLNVRHLSLSTTAPAVTAFSSTAITSTAITSTAAVSTPTVASYVLGTRYTASPAASYRAGLLLWAQARGPSKAAATVAARTTLAPQSYTFGRRYAASPSVSYRAGLMHCLLAGTHASHAWGAKGPAHPGLRRAAPASLAFGVRFAGSPSPSYRQGLRRMLSRTEPSAMAVITTPQQSPRKGVAAVKQGRRLERMQLPIGAVAQLPSSNDNSTEAVSFEEHNATAVGSYAPAPGIWAAGSVLFDGFGSVEAFFLGSTSSA